MFHSKDMGEIWHMEILAEPTSALPSEEHINPIKCTKMPIFFGKIKKHRFSLKIGEVNVNFFGSRERLVS